MHRILLNAMFMLLCALDPVQAQNRPDFSGTWMRVDEAPEKPSVAAAGDLEFRVGSMGSGWGSPLTIRQTSTALVVEYAHFLVYDMQPPIRLRYALDGSDSANTLMLSHAEATQHSRAAWQLNSLVISTPVPVPGSSDRVEVRQVLSLESPTTLVIETTRSALGGRPPSVTRERYSRGT